MTRTLPIGFLVLLLSVPALAQEEPTEEELRVQMCTTKTTTLTATRGGYHTGEEYVAAFQAQATLTVTNPCDADRLLVEIIATEAAFDFECHDMEIHQPLTPVETDDDWEHHRYTYRGHGYAVNSFSYEEGNAYVSLHYPGNQGGACPEDLDIKEGDTRRFWVSFDLNRVDNTKPFKPLEPFQVVYGEYGNRAVVLTFP